MEGRAIARPNYRGGRLWGLISTLQWRAEQLPGQTSTPATTVPTGIRCFNGGPSNCPAKPVRACTGAGLPTRSFNGGPSNCPAKRPYSASSAKQAAQLQWRAEQLPGQTVTEFPEDYRERVASMEGRAIARPNQLRRGAAVPRGVASMEGRAIARPNLGRVDHCLGELVASMEGRAIARPNSTVRGRSTPASLLQWRAEQLPGQTRHPPQPQPPPTPLQWRAEQLPGQTRRQPGHQRPLDRDRFNGGPSNCPAKRGAALHLAARHVGGFNGGPSNCPAKLKASEDLCIPRYMLQWRAEQLPGQTRLLTGGPLE